MVFTQSTKLNAYNKQYIVVQKQVTLSDREFSDLQKGLTNFNGLLIY